ncbi:MAG: NAD-dependent deacylase [Bacteroidota bacterium]
MNSDDIKLAAELIRESNRTVAFTGAGISVESGIPPFRGEGGLWSKYDPIFLDINYFKMNPNESWVLIKEIFYDYFGQAKPNGAHTSLARMEQDGQLQSIITQNIDNLHFDAGSREVYEFHGNSRQLICQRCNNRMPVKEFDLKTLPPRCPQCDSVLKPDFIFFGEGIPEPANSNSFAEIHRADVFILIGTSGEIMPASLIPFEAQKMGKKIIEINIEPSNYTSISDVFLQGKASEVMERLVGELN